MEEIYDGFEKEVLSDLWDTRKFVLGAVEIQDRVVRAGKRALRVMVSEGEKSEVGGSGTKSERAELQERKDLESFEGKSYEYSFSIFLPEDFPIVPVRLVLAQWKHRENEGVKALVNNPVIALRYVNSKLYITSQDGKRKKVIFQTKEEVRGKWLDFRFQIKFSRNEDGFLKVILNEEKIVDFGGRTCFSEEEGYPKQGRFFFKMGLYRDRMREPMFAYFDEYSKESLLL